MSVKKGDSLLNKNHKGRKRKDSELLVKVQSDALKLQLSPMFDEIERFSASLDKFQATFNAIALAQKNLVESVTFPYNQLTDSLKTLANFQTRLAEDVRKVSQLSDSAIQGIVSYQSIANQLVFNSGILEIANTFKSFQVRAFTGLVVTSELIEKVSSSYNGINQISRIQGLEIVAGGMLKVDVEKDTSSVSSQIIYKKVETIEVKLDLVASNFSKSDERIQLLEHKVESQIELINSLMNNPLQYFKIFKIIFNKATSHFVVNDSITIKVQPNTLHDYLCQVLFSGYKQHLSEEWFIDEILEYLEPLIGVAEASNLTWKKIQEAVTKINQKIAMETTIKDVILMPRTEIIKLNPSYFTE